MQKSFDKLKALAGSWDGTMEGKPSPMSLRVTSSGNALMHEMRGSGGPDDPITLFHPDDDRSLMTHYCDAGNLPCLVATISPGGKTITFNFPEANNLWSSQMGHRQSVLFNLMDSDLHTEKWGLAMADGKQMEGVLGRTRSQ